ncbi:MAG TPA: DUF6526 family protein [Daejeonella sp.]|nr:DUF6526 family protein [Daejeonella sp.]
MEQNYQNHIRIITGYHRILAALLVLGLIGSIVNLSKSMGSDELYSASLIVLLFICGMFLFWYSRSFALKAQDRAIRAEENFRYYILTGKTLPTALRMGQIVALRFAPDEEFSTLAERALKENLSSKAIKQAIKNWKADYDRA